MARPNWTLARATLRRVASATLATLIAVQPAAAGNGYFFRLNGTGNKKLLTITGPTTVYGHLGSSVRASYKASGGDVPYQWGAVALPDAVTIDGFGRLSGLPSAAGTKHVTIVASDQGSASAELPVDLVILGELEVVGVADLETGVGVANATVAPTAVGNPVAPVTWSLAAGATPPGMGVDRETGAVAGTPSAVGTYTMSVQAEDATGATAVSASFTVKVDDVLTLGSQGGSNLVARVAVPYRSRVPSVGPGFKPPAAWSISGTGFPAGLDVDPATGSIVGTATTPTPATPFVEKVVDAANRQGSLNETITVLPPLTFAADDGSGAYEGWFRSGVAGSYAPPAPPTLQGGSWSLASGTLPYGLGVDEATGAIKGTPTRPLDPSEVTDVKLSYALTEPATGARATSPTVTLHVFGPLVIGREPDLSGTTNVAMSSPAVPVTGRYARSHMWSVYAPPPAQAIPLPTGLGLDGDTGAIAGKVTTGYGATQQLAVTDATGTFPTNAFVVTTSPKFVVTPPAAKTGRQGMPLSVAAPAVGKGYVAPLTFGTSAPLQGGLSIDPKTGAISGTPTNGDGSAHPVTITAVDTTGYESDAAAFPLTVLPPLGVALGADPTLGSLTTGTTAFATHPGFQVSIPVSILNAPQAPGTWSAASIAAMPAGLRFKASLDGLSGTITGSIAAAGDQTFTLEAKDSTGAKASTTLVAHVVPPVSAAGPTLTARIGVSVVPPDGCSRGCSFYGTTIGAVASNAVGGVTWYPADDGSLLPDGMGYETTRGAKPAFTGRVAGAPKGPDGTGPVEIVVADALDTPAQPSRAVGIGSATIVKALDFATAPASRVTDHAGVRLTPTDALTVVNGPVGTVTMVETGTMPPGLSFDTATGVVSGTPSTPGDWAIKVSAFDAQYETTPTYAVAIHVDNAIQVGDGSPIAPYVARVGVPLFAPPAPPAILNSTSPPFTWVLSPPIGGVTLDANGAMSGTPSRAGTTTTAYVVSDSQGAIGHSVPFDVTVLDALSVASLSRTNYVTDVVTLPEGAPSPAPVAPLSWELTNLPPGLSYDAATGAIAGSPTTAGTYDGAIAVNDAWGAPADATFHWVVYPQVVVDALKSPAPSTYVGAKDYDLAPPVVENARGTITWAAAPANPAPPGMSVDPATGHVRGVPTTAGTYQVAFQATDGGSFVATGPTFGIVVRPPLAVASTKAFTGREGIVKKAPAFAVTAGGTGTGGWSLAGTPSWMAITADGGILSDLPPAGAAGAYAVTATWTDADGESASATATETILPPIAIATIPDQDARVRTAFTLVVPTLANAPVAPVKWDAATLPDGLTFDPATQTISGKPTTAVTTTVRLTGQDAEGATFATNAFAIAVRGPLTLTLAGGPTYYGHQNSPTTVPSPIVGGNPKAPYSITACCTYSGPNGDMPLPVGMGMSGAAPTAGSGGIRGIPTDVGTYAGVAYTISDATGGTATSAPFTLVVNPPLKVAPMADVSGRVGLASKQVQAPAVSGNPTVPLAWTTALVTLAAGDPTAASCPGGTTPNADGTTTCALPVPSGLTLDPVVGFVSGTPKVAGTFPEVFAVADSAGGSATTNQFAITIIPALAVASDQGDLAVHVGSAVSVAGPTLLNAPVAPVTWSVASGTLAAGLTLDATTGTISGTPTADNEVGSPAVKLTAVDAQGATFTGKPFNLAVYGTLAMAAIPDLDTSPGHPETVTPAVTHAAPTATYAVAGLPDGFRYDASTGVVSGSATTVGSSTVTETVTDGLGVVASRSFAIKVEDALVVSATPDKTTRVGQNRLVAQAAAQNAARGVVWSTAAGYAAPAGLSLDAVTGRLAGSATTVGTTHYAFKATDGNGRTASGQPFDVTVYSPLSIGSAGSFALRQGVTATIPAPVVGNTPAQPVTWTLAPGSNLPSGFTLDGASGAVTGTPTAAQANTTASFALTATDAQGASISDNATGQPAALTFYAPLTTTTPATAYGHVGQALAIAAPAVGNTPIAPTAWTAAVTLPDGSASTSLPGGLAVNASTGAITGTPTAAAVGTSIVVLTVRDATGGTVSTGAFAITIQPTMTMAAIPNQNVHNNVAHATPAPALTNASGPVTYAYASSPAGLVAGTATSGVATQPASLAAGTYAETVTATDGSGATATRTFNVVVAPPLTAAVPTSATFTFQTAKALPAPVVANALGTVSYALASGALPAGVTLDATTGVASGTPTAQGTFPVAIAATDATGVTASTGSFNVIVTYALASAAYPTAVATYTSSGSLSGNVPLATLGDASATTTAAIAAGGYEVVSYQYPVQFDGSVDTDAGTRTIYWNSGTVASPTWTVVSAGATVGSSQYKIVFPAASTPARLRLGYAGAYPAYLPSLTAGKDRPVVGVAYTGTLDTLLSTLNASGTESWALASGTLPAGFSLDPTGRITGTPTASGDATVTLTVTDSRGIPSVAGTLVLSVQSNLLASTIYPASAQSVGQGAYYTFQQPAPVAAAVAAGYDGTTGTGYVGTTQSNGGFAAGVRYTFAQPVSWDGSVSSVATPASATIVGLYYNTGTTASPTWVAWTAASGAVTSTDFEVISYYYNSVPTLQTARLGYGGTYPAALPSITGTRVTPVVGTAYAASLDATMATLNGTGQETWTVTAGTLPAGLTLDATAGTITGTPTTIGDATVTLTVTDSRGLPSVTAALVVSVQSNVVAGTTYPSSATDVGSGASATAVPLATLYDASATTVLTNGSATASTAVLTYAQPVAWDGSLDATPTGGVSVAYNTGTAASPVWTAYAASLKTVTSSQFKVNSTTSGFLSKARLGTAAAYPAYLPSLTSAKVRPVVGTALQLSLDATMATANASGTESWAMTGTLPAGLSFDPAAGTISGTPTAIGDATVTLSVTDARGIPSVETALVVSVQSNVLASTTYPATAGYMGDCAMSPVDAAYATPVATTYDASATTVVPSFVGYPGFSTTFCYGSNVTYTFGQPVQWDGSVALQNASGHETLWYLGPSGWAQWTSAAGVVTATRFALINDFQYSIAPTYGARLGYGGAYPAFLPSLTAPATQRPVVGTPFSVTLDALMATTNASGAETWAVTAGTMPAGLTLDAAGGTISGTPTTVGDATLTMTVTDSRGLPSVGAKLTLSVQSNVLASTAYPSTFSANGSNLVTAPYDNSTATGFTLIPNYGSSAVFTFAQPVAFDGSIDTDLATGNSVVYYALPGGGTGTWTAATGVVSTTAITVVSSLPYYAVNPTPTRMRIGYGGKYPAFLPSLTAGKDKPVVGTAYAGNLDAVLAVTNSTGGETWTLASGTMPTGLTLNANGTVTGTPTTSGDTTVTVSMTDSRGFATAPVGLTLSVQSSVQASTTYPSSATSVGCGAYSTNCATSTVIPVATPYDGSLATAVGPVSGSSVSGVRLTFAQPVAWDGTVAMAGTGGAAATSPVLYYSTGTTASPVWTQWTSATGTVTSTDFELLANNGATGLATAKMGYGNQFPAALPSLTATKDRPVVGTAYSASLDTLMATANASGGETWALASGTLPSGLSLNAGAGTITGTPTASGDSTVTLTVTDARGIASVPTSLVLSVQSNVQASTTYPSSATSIGCGAYSTNCATSVALPVATTYDASAATALPLVNSSWSGVRLTFAQPVAWDGSTSAATSTATVAPSYFYYNTGTTASPVWTAWTTASGVVTSTDFEVVLNSTSALAKAEVGYGGQFPAPLPSLTATKDRPVVGSAYSVTLDALMKTANASAAETWALTSGTLPSGLTFDPVAGTISGAPTTTGDQTVTLTVTDARGIASVPTSLTLSVQSSVLASTVYPTSWSNPSWNYNSNPYGAGSVGALYDNSASTAFGLAGLYGSAYGGVLTFAQPVAFDGTVDSDVTSLQVYYNAGTAGSPTWTLWSTASGVVTASQFEIVGNQSGKNTRTRLGYGGAFPGYLPSLTSPSRQLATVGGAYSATLDALMATTDASGTESWALASGTLPAGLSLDPVAGTISGTPTAPGDSVVTVTVTDARGIASAPTTLTLSVQSNVRASTAYPSSSTSIGCGAYSPGGACANSAQVPVATVYDASTATALGSFSGSGFSGARLTFAQPVAWDGSVAAATSTGSVTPTVLYYNAGTTASPTWVNWTASSGTVTSTDFEVIYNSGNAAVTLATAKVGYGNAFPAALPSLTAPATVNTVVGIAYSANLATLAPATNLSDSGTWSLASGSLPTGLTLGSDGTLSGTPTVGGSSTTATVTVADGRGLPAAPVTLNVTVAATAATVYALSATNSTGANAVSVGGLYDGSATTGTNLVAGGTLTLAFSSVVAWDGSLDVAFTGVPGTPQYNSGTTASPVWTNYGSGTVSTTGIRLVASTAGTLSTLRAGFGGSYPGFLPSGSPATLSLRPNVATSASLDAALATTNVSGGEFWARYSGTVPTGLALDANSAGTLSGTPTTEGTSVVYWTVKDSRGAYSDPIALTIAVQAQPVLSAGSDVASTSQAYRNTLAALTGATGLSTPTWSASNLPPGVTLAPTTGVLSGTPTTAGSYATAVSVRNASGLSATATVTFAVGYGASTLANGLIAYFPFSEGSGSTTTDAVAGVVMTEAGTASGLFTTGKIGTGASVPSTATARAPWGKLTGAAARSTSAWVKGTSSGTVVSWGNCTNGNDWYLDVTGTTLRFGACGGSYDVTGSANVTDGAWHLLTATYDGSTIRAYADGTLVGSGGVGSIATSSSDVWIANRSDTPTGAAYANPYTGAIDEVGVWNRALSAAEVASLYASGRGNAGPGFLGTAPTLSPATLGAASGATVSTSLATATGAGNLQAGATWATTSGSFPTGLALSGAGVLSGSSTAVGTTTAVVTATNPDGSSNATTVAVTVAPPASGVLPTGATGSSGTPTVGGLMDASSTTGAAVAAGGTVTLAYAQAVAWDGTASTAFSGTAGSSQYNAGSAAAPAWANYASGTVATTGIRFVAATGGTLSTFRPGYGGAYPAALPSLSAGSLATQGNAPVSANLGTLMAPANATGARTWAIASGALPTGVSLAADGTLSGAATSGTSSAQVTVTDSRGVPSEPATLTVTVAAGPTLQPARLDGRVGLAVAPTDLATLMGATNASSANWSLTAGSLPAGLSLSGTGIVTGTPTMTGSSSATVTVTSASGATASATLSSTVIGPLTIGSGGSYVLREGVPATVPAPGVGNAPVAPGTWTVAAGTTLPNGFTLDGTSGSTSGTPSASLSGTSADVTLAFRDAQGATVTGSSSPAHLAFRGQLQVQPVADVTATVGQPYAGSAPSVSNGPVSPAWTVNGTLPDGLSLDPATGAIAGTPTTTGSATVSLTVTDATGGIATTNAFVVTASTAP